MDKARQLFGLEFDCTHRPYILDPSLTMETQDKVTYLVGRLGGASYSQTRRPDGEYLRFAQASAIRPHASGSGRDAAQATPRAIHAIFPSRPQHERTGCAHGRCRHLQPLKPS
eukprot:6120964-Prymnesium_polylepis.1